MYHIKRDARSHHSAEAIVEGLETCLKKKAFSDLTVSEICLTAGIGRATFYRLFDNLTDILAYQADEVVRLAGIKLKQENYSVREACVMITGEWMKHVNLMKAVMEGKQLDILVEATLRQREVIRIKAAGNQPMGQEELDFLMNFLTVSLPLGLLLWYRNGKKESAEELTAKVKKCHLWLGKLL